MTGTHATSQAVHAAQPPADGAESICAQAKNTALVLRTCRADMSSSNDFVWPEAGGIAKALDWKDSPVCGNGLHGWLYGQGDFACSGYLGSTAKWLVVKVDSDRIVMLDGACKFPMGQVLFVGDRKDATDYLRAHEPRAREVAVIGAQLVAGGRGAVAVGALGTTTAGNHGTATAGDYGTASAGNYGKATAGFRGTATAGERGTAMAGDKGALHIRYRDLAAKRDRTTIGYIGEDGIKANVAYRLDDNHKLVKA